MCDIYWCNEIRNTDDSPLFMYETFINFLTIVFRHEERETHFLICWLYYLTQQTHPVAPKISVGRDLQSSIVSTPSWTGPAQSQISTNVFFKITKFSAHRFRAWRHSHPSRISYLGFLLWHLWLSYPLCVSGNCAQCVCTCTNSRIVQSPTKLNDKI